MSNALTVQPSQRLVLLDFQHQGQALSFTWQWPGAAGKVGLDAVLADAQHVDAELLLQARHCTVQQVGPQAQPVWLLGNSSQTLVCSVNQQVLAPGSQVRLDHGDEIELGLTRFAVSLHAESPQAHANGEAPDTSFDLTNLDAPADIPTPGASERYGDDRSDFSDLMSLVSQEQAVPEVAADDDHALFAALHAQYLAKLRNPSHTDEQDHWQEILRGNQSSQPDPMQQWMKAAGPGHSLDDLLGQPHSIDSVIQGLDALGASDVLAPDPFDSVMHLFAPEHLREPRTDATDSLESLVQRSLPGLTRREHHSLSLDSVMPFTGGQEPPPTSQSNEKKP